jgi:DNA (cytosine-5)-methyltransferase 3A
MNVLSLFDGMSCGQIALTGLGCFPDKYYASEVDKFAIQQTTHVFPDTIQLGDVTKVDVSKLDKIDLLIGGSPCQSFSFAGKKIGMVTTDKVYITDLQTYLDLKEMGFEFEGQSYLFWEYMRILADIRKYNPDVKFLLENVKMSKKWEAVLTKAIGVQPVMINSNLVSAQNRKRLYWTNIAEIPQPEDEGILIRDILEDEVDEKYYISDRALEGMTNHARVNAEKGNGFGARIVSPEGKANTILRNCHKDGRGNLIVDSRGRPDCLATVQKGNLLQFRGMLRRLTPTECARLQTVPEWYEWIVSDTQIYRMCGNGWTVKVIEHILGHLFKN